MRKPKFLAAIVLAASLALAGCATPQAPAPRMEYQLGSLPKKDEIVMVSGGDVQLITQRDSATAGGPQIVCLSPSPDWATTVNLKRELDAKGNAANTAGGSLTLDSESSTGNAQMAGRTAAVVALRDALYQACQANGNGVLGRAAYAVTLSQFGNILTAVLQAQAPAAPAAPAGGDAAAAGLLQLALVQQQHIQALVVACLNTYDPSLPALAASSASPVLTQAQCQTLIGNIVAASPALLKPVLPPPAAPPAAAKPAAPDVAKPAPPAVAKPAAPAKPKVRKKTGKPAAG